MRSAHLAVDLGASSGRVMLGVLSGEGSTLTLREAHRFEHTPVTTPTGPVWDFTGIVREMIAGIRAGAAAASEEGALVRSVGVDSWGVDWSVVGPSGEIIALPRCYRDPANAAAKKATLERLEGGAEALYARNGIQPLPFNTLFQVSGRLAATPEVFPAGGRVQLMPDLLHYVLTEKLSNEVTNASTGGWLASGGTDWDRGLFDQLNIPQQLFGSLSMPGTCLGRLRPEIASAVDLDEATEVVLPATHDTASAIAAVPETGSASTSWAYLSSGTWSLLGAERYAAIGAPEALNAGFTNELGAPIDGRPTVRLLRNIGGLWLLQELRRDLARRGEQYGYAELTELAIAAQPHRTLVDPNADDLAAPGDSIAKLQGHAKRTGQPIPETAGQLARCCFESLAVCYADTLQRLERLTGDRIERLHIVGGGRQNQLLNQMTADASGVTVLLGPTEATAIGNLLVQAIGLGLVRDLPQAREIVARSFPTEMIEPSGAEAWSSERSKLELLSSKHK